MMFCSTSAVNALTIDELAAQFESYKKSQNAQFDQLRTENLQLKQQSR